MLYKLLSTSWHIFLSSSTSYSGFLCSTIWARTMQKSKVMNAALFIFSYYMKVRSSSTNKKRKVEIQQDRNIQETATPRVKRCVSATKTNYLQLQLDTSSKKRQNLEKNMAGKDKRIKELENQVKEFQDFVVNVSKKCKDYKVKYDQEKNKNQRIQVELKQAVHLCKNMNEKCQDLFARNQALESSEKEWKHKYEAEEKKLKELKEQRRKQKKEIRELILNLLPMLNAQSSQVDSQQIKRLSKML